MEAVLTARGLTKQYDGVTAVRQLTVDIAAGRVTGILGPNGSGKSTTLKMALGLARPTCGTVRVLGREYRGIRHPATQVGALLEAGGAHPGRTGRNHLRVVALAARIPPERVDHVLDVVGLVQAADRKVKTYSLGMRQRLGLATALLGDPRLLILDEPSNGLDPTGTRWLRGTLREYAAGGGSVVVASHVLPEIEQLADDLVILQHGRLVVSGTMAQVVGGHGSLEAAYLHHTHGAEERRAR